MFLNKKYFKNNYYHDIGYGVVVWIVNINDIK
jgi:hypothetical protein